MSLKILLVLVAMALVAGPASTAVGAMAPGGCPAGYVAFDRQTGDGGPPRYRQGETVAASGVITNTDAGVTEVTLRWGTSDGPEVGRAAVDASGSWQGISFQIPQDVVDGEQQVFYVARDRTGQMLPGLPYPFAIEVGEPRAPATGAAAPATKSAAVAPRSSTKKADRPERPAATAGKPAVVETVRAPTRSKPAATTPAPVAARTRPAETKRPSRPARKSSSPDGASGEPRPSSRASAAEKPDSGTRLTTAARPTQAGARFPSRAPAPAVVGTRDPDASNGWDAVPVLAAIGLLLLLGFGAFGAGALAERRRRDGGDGTGAEPGSAGVACPIESELHAMLAERERDAGAPDRQDTAPVG